MRPLLWRPNRLLFGAAATTVGVRHAQWIADVTAPPSGDRGDTPPAYPPDLASMITQRYEAYMSLAATAAASRAGKTSATAGHPAFRSRLTDTLTNDATTMAAPPVDAAPSSTAALSSSSAVAPLRPLLRFCTVAQDRDTVMSFFSVASSAATGSTPSSAQTLGEAQSQNTTTDSSGATTIDIEDVFEVRLVVHTLLRSYAELGRMEACKATFLRALKEIPAELIDASYFDLFLQILAQQATFCRQEVTWVLHLMVDVFRLPLTASTYLSLFEMHVRMQVDPLPLWRRMTGASLDEVDFTAGYEGKQPQQGSTATAAAFRPQIDKFAVDILGRRHVISSSVSSTPLPSRETKAVGDEECGNSDRGGLSIVQQLSRTQVVEPTWAILNLLVHGALPNHPDVGFIVDVLRRFLAVTASVDHKLLRKHLSYLLHHKDTSAEIGLWLLFELEQRCLVERVNLKDTVDRSDVVWILYKTAKCGDWRTADRVNALVDRHTMQRSTDVLSLLVWTYAAGEQVERAFDMLEEMSRRGLLENVDFTRRYVLDTISMPISKHYLMTLIDSLHNVDLVDRAYYHLERRHDNGQSVSVHSLDVIVHACGKIGDDTRAIETMESYQTRFGIKPRTHSYHALLLSCVGKHKARQHRTVLDAMQANNVRPNSYTLRLLIRQAMLCDNVEEAMEFLQMVPTLPSVKPEIEHLLPILEKAAKVGDAETVEAVLNFGLEHQLPVDSTLLKGCVEQLKSLGLPVKELEERLLPEHEALRQRLSLRRRATKSASN